MEGEGFLERCSLIYHTIKIYMFAFSFFLFVCVCFTCHIIKPKVTEWNVEAYQCHAARLSLSGQH